MQQVTDSNGASTQQQPVQQSGATGIATVAKNSHVNGGRFDFDDGGTYCGGWEEGKAHGHGVCTGPKGQGAYSGSWHYGFEVSGVYTWPSGSCFEGQWQNGKRHGLGVETRGRWIYRGEWSQGFKGRYGVRQSNTSTAKYEGTWANGLQDGCGSETYADDGTYQGQWLRGMRHGYGVRNSAPFGKASKYRANKTLRASLTSLRSNEGNPGGGGGGGGGGNPEAVEKRDRRVDDSRGGFVLKSDSSEPVAGGRRRSLGSGNIKKGLLMGLKLKKQSSTGELEKRGGGGSGSIRSTGSSASWLSTDSAQSGMTNNSIPSDSNASFVVEDAQLDPSVKEIYMGEWKNDKRSGFGISERSDGLKYEGEWYGNKKYGYGITTFSNGEKEEGKYKNNVLITSQKKKLFLMRSAKFRDRIDAAVSAAQRASKIALQKADIAISRTATARGKAEQADLASAQARVDSDVAMSVAKQYAPDFKQPGLDRLMKMRQKYAGAQLDSPVDKEGLVGNQVQAGGGINVKQNVMMQNQTQQNYYHHQEPTLNSLSNTTMTNNPPMVNSINSPPPHNVMNDVTSQTTTALNSDLKPQPINDLLTMNKQNQIHQNQVNQNNQVVMNQVQKTTNTMMKTRNSLSGSMDLQSAHHQMNNNNNNVASNSSMLRRASRRVSGDRPYLGNIGQQSSIDHFDHYKRPPSRDSSVDRYSRATGRLSGSIGSRQASVERSSRPSETPDRGIRAPSVVRGTTPAPLTPNSPSGVQPPSNRNGSVLTGSGAKAGHANSPGGSAVGHGTTSPPFEEIILRKRGLGQDIIPSPNQPKRTESLFVPGAPAHQQATKNLVQQSTLQRKKSLPDFQELPRSTGGAMSREEVSYLGSARREEVRRQVEERERLRANPLLYLVSPQVKDWLSRQQLVIIVLFVNISLAIMFFKLLT